MNSHVGHCPHIPCQVCAGPVAQAEFVGLDALTLKECSTLELPVRCTDAWGNEGATGPALVSIDHFLTMSSWLSSKDTKKRYELTDPVVPPESHVTYEARCILCMHVKLYMVYGVLEYFQQSKIDLVIMCYGAKRLFFNHGS